MDTLCSQLKAKVAACGVKFLVQGMLQNIGEEWLASEELCIQLESFVSALYGAKKGTKDINQCRYAVFCAKKGDRSRIAPVTAMQGLLA